MKNDNYIIERAVNKTIYERRHKEFQLGTNPMQMTAMEKSLKHKEAEERKDARHKYIQGIQGRDGGCISQKYEEEYEDGPKNI